MCGIAGIAPRGGGNTDEAALRRMAQALIHRGPDDERFLRQPGIGFAFRRLSIIDVRGSHQPIANETRTVWAMCNGEIYNYKPLRAELARRGHIFATEGDAETVVHAYEEWGRDFPAHLRGMFALALWDAPRARLLLARDRLGIKPLYYGTAGDTLVFASELRALLAAELLPRDIDHRALDLYLSFLHVPCPHTAFAAARKLPPGSILVRDADGCRIDTYWMPPPAADASAGAEDAPRKLRALLEDAVGDHLQSDVPVGFFLSGGLDSSALVALAARRNSGARVATFSVGFEARSHNELPYARELARACRCDHREFTVRADAAQVLPRIVSAFHEPYGDSSAVPYYYICQAAAQHVKVVVGGDGGDELFVGYDWTRRQRFIERWNRLPASARAAAAGLLRGRAPRASHLGKLARFVGDAAAAPLDGYLRRISCLDDERKRALYAGPLAAVLPDATAHSMIAPFFANAPDDALEAMNRADLGVYLPDDDLCKVDRMSMAHSLEGRVPLLDDRVVAFALALPMAMKLRGVTTKYIFKQAVKDLLPPSLLRQRKQGFAIPVARWMRRDLHADAARLLLTGPAPDRGLFNVETVRRMLAEHREGTRDHGHPLWALLVLELWFRICVDRDAPADASARTLADF